MKHECPVEGCQVLVAHDLLMCGTHWRMVPRDLGRAVWHAWRDGQGIGTDEHREACQAAVDAVNARLKGAGT